MAKGSGACNTHMAASGVRDLPTFYCGIKCVRGHACRLIKNYDISRNDSFAQKVVNIKIIGALHYILAKNINICSMNIHFLRNWGHFMAKVSGACNMDMAA